MSQEWDEKEARRISCEKWIFGGKELGGRFQWESGTVKETSKGIPGCRMLLILLRNDFADEYGQKADDKVNIMMRRRRSRGQGRHRQGRQFTFSASDSPPPAAAGPLLGTALARYMY